MLNCMADAQPSIEKLLSFVVKMTFDLLAKEKIGIRLSLTVDVDLLVGGITI